MAKRLSESLGVIARGSSVVFAGIVASLVLNFVLRIALVRDMSQEDYGLYSLAVTLAGIVCAVAVLGLDEGSARHIAYFRGRSEDAQAGGIVAATWKIALLSSVVFAAVLFVFSDAIATGLFRSPGLSGILKALAFSIPFAVLIQVLASIMRGYSETWSRAFFKDTLRPLLFLAFMLGIIALRLPFFAVVYAYLASMALAFGALAVYTARCLRVRGTKAVAARAGVTRDLLGISLPLLSVSLLMLLMSQATEVLLGVFADPVAVGKYDIAILMASQVLTVINSLGYAYTPAASGLFGQGRLEELKRSYVVATRWGYVLTLPVVFVLLLFPAPLLALLFGSGYAGIAPVLQVIVLGYLVNTLTGPNYHTLIAAGRMRLIIESFLLNAASNLALCFLLIPPFGIAGAAVAAGVSSALGNLLLSARLYQQLGVHPLTRSYLASIAASVALLGAFYVLLNYTPLQLTIWIAPPCLALFAAAYGGALLLLRAVDPEDVALLAAVERRIGIKVTPVIARYVH